MSDLTEASLGGCGVEGTVWVRQSLDPIALEFLGNFDVLLDVRLRCAQTQETKKKKTESESLL